MITAKPKPGRVSGTVNGAGNPSVFNTAAAQTVGQAVALSQ
jgi:hypothetical protein